LNFESCCCFFSWRLRLIWRSMLEMRSSSLYKRMKLKIHIQVIFGLMLIFIVQFSLAATNPTDGNDSLLFMFFIFYIYSNALCWYLIIYLLCKVEVLNLCFYASFVKLYVHMFLIQLKIMLPYCSVSAYVILCIQSFK